MNTTYLREFLVLSETKNYWEASERLFMNESTLSKHMKSLEAELGVTLFDRTTRRVALTEYGSALYPYAQEILKQEFDLQSLMQQLKNEKKGLLSLGSIPTMVQYHIINLWLSFYQLHPDCQIKILEADPKQLIEALYNRTCELIFQRELSPVPTDHASRDSSLEYLPYIQDHLVAILPCHHPLAQNKSIHLRELADENFCFIKEGSLMNDLCTSACQAAGFIPQVVFTTHRIESILDMVTNGSCVALLMNHHVLPPIGTAETARPFATVDIVPYVHSQVSLCYLKDRKLSPTADAFVSYCKESFVDHPITSP